MNMRKFEFLTPRRRYLRNKSRDFGDRRLKGMEKKEN